MSAPSDTDSVDTPKPKRSPGRPKGSKNKPTAKPARKRGPRAGIPAIETLPRGILAETPVPHEATVTGEIGLPDDIALPAGAARISPLEYMLRVMVNPGVPPERRDRMAVSAAPFVHQKRESAASADRGIKAKRADDAQEVIQRADHLAPGAPPQLVAVTGGRAA